MRFSSFLLVALAAVLVAPAAQARKAAIPREVKEGKFEGSFAKPIVDLPGLKEKPSFNQYSGRP